MPVKQYGPRTRSRGNFNSNTPSFEIAGGPAANWTQLLGYTPPVGTTEAMTDVVLENFSKRRAAGELMFNPMTKVVITHHDSSRGPSVTQLTPAWAVGQTYSVTGNFISGRIGGVSASPMTSIPASMIPKVSDWDTANRAIAEACTQAQRSPSNANVLVTLAELDKTRRLVPDLLNNWTKLLRKINEPSRRIGTRKFTGNVDWKGIGRNLSLVERTSVETWLAMRFGVRPLIMDTLGVIEAIKAASSGERYRVTQRGHASVTVPDAGMDEYASGVTRTQISRSEQTRIDVRAMSIWEAKMDLVRDAGVSLSAIPEAAIDLVRFSFVLNWLVNVNDFCSSIGSALDPGLTNRGGTYVLELEGSATYQALSSRSTDSTYAINTSASGICTVSSLQKWRVVGLVSPKLVVRADPLKFLRDLRILDATALLRQQLRGRNVRGLAKVSNSLKSF